MSDTPISQMSDKQLRNEVQLLRDELAMMQRKYEDILYNLDNDNFSGRFLKEKNDMQTSIEATAEGIKTKVSKEDLKAYSTIEQTAEQIKSTVTKEFVVNQLDGEIVTNATLTSKVNQTADEIRLSVSQEYETKSDANTSYNSLRGSISSVSVEADRISSKVANMENGEFGDYTLFVQTSSGFELTGDVSISGDSIVSGTISASRIETEGLSCTRLYAKNNYNGYFAKLNGNIGDFGIFNSMATDYTASDSPYCMFGVYNSFPNINLYIYGHNFLGYDTQNDKIWVKGNWDFSVANVDGLQG